MKKPKPTINSPKKGSEEAKARTKTSYRSSKYRAGKRGIPFGFETFEDFHGSMGDRPSLEHTLDRIDNAKGYVRGNLRWATKTQQAENRSTTIRVSYQGKNLTAWEFARELGISVDTVYRGVRSGRSAEQIAFLSREASASKPIPEPWPWPAGDEHKWERAYKAHARSGESREQFLCRICRERYAAMMQLLIRPCGGVEPEVIGMDEEMGEPIYKSEPLPPGFLEHLERVKHTLADAEAKLAAAARRATDPFGHLFNPRGTP